MNIAQEIVQSLKDKSVKHQDTIAAGFGMAGAMTGIYLGLFHVKIKYLVLLGLIVLSGGIGYLIYLIAKAVFQKLNSVEEE